MKWQIVYVVAAESAKRKDTDQGEQYREAENVSALKEKK